VFPGGGEASDRRWRLRGRGIRAGRLEVRTRSACLGAGRGVDEVRLEVSTHDAIAQRTESHHVVISESGIRLYPVRIRYAPVAELDLMARLAGLRLRERWADRDRSKLASTSQKHISVWELDR
jgi:hypothetical protein